MCNQFVLTWAITWFDTFAPLSTELYIPPQNHLCDRPGHWSGLETLLVYNATIGKCLSYALRIFTKCSRLTLLCVDQSEYNMAKTQTIRGLQVINTSIVIKSVNMRWRACLKPRATLHTGVHIRHQGLPEQGAGDQARG
jgi:hypothetical protein